MKKRVPYVFVLFFIVLCLFEFLYSWKVYENADTGGVKDVTKETLNPVASAVDTILKEAEDIIPPNIIQLSSKEVEIHTVKEAGELPALNMVKVLQLGSLMGKEIDIILYSDNDNNIHGVFQYGEKKYVLQYLGYASDIDSVCVHKLQLLYNKGSGLYLLSGIGSPILGYQYVIFDSNSNKWLFFQNWGVPQVLNSKQSESPKVLLQFPGLHLNGPDLNILSFIDGNFRITDVNESISKISKIQTNPNELSSSFIKWEEDKAVVSVSFKRNTINTYLYYLVNDQLNTLALYLKKEF